MPELPEVETLRRGLERDTLGSIVVDVDVANAKVLKGQSREEFRRRLLGATIRRVNRRGKFLLLSLSSRGVPDENYPESNPSDSNLPPLFLCVHLKMRGQLLLESASTSPGPYHCVSLLLSAHIEGESEAKKTALRFYDMWTWGEMRALTAEECATVAGLNTMGPEPLEEGWDGASLRTGLGTRKVAIKSALLDQKVVAGVGNIYADESLYRSRIHPERSAASLTVEETDRLASAIRAVLSDAVRGGGTESEEYVDLEGTVGRYRPQVYDQGGKECVTCGAVLKKIRLGGRGTVFCPECQS